MHVIVHGKLFVSFYECQNLTDLMHSFETVISCRTIPQVKTPQKGIKISADLVTELINGHINGRLVRDHVIMKTAKLLVYFVHVNGPQ